jgi:hypothetical protein
MSRVRPSIEAWIIHDTAYVRTPRACGRVQVLWLDGQRWPGPRRRSRAGGLQSVLEPAHQPSKESAPRPSPVEQVRPARRVCPGNGSRRSDRVLIVAVATAVTRLASELIRMVRVLIIAVLPLCAAVAAVALGEVHRAGPPPEDWKQGAFTALAATAVTATFLAAANRGRRYPPRLSRPDTLGAVGLAFGGCFYGLTHPEALHARLGPCRMRRGRSPCTRECGNDPAEPRSCTQYRIGHGTRQPLEGAHHPTRMVQPRQPCAAPARRPGGLPGLGSPSPAPNRWVLSPISAAGSQRRLRGPET